MLGICRLASEWSEVAVRVMCVWMCECMRVCVHMRVCLHGGALTRVSVCVCVCVCVCVRVYLYPFYTCSLGLQDSDGGRQ